MIRIDIAHWCIDRTQEECQMVGAFVGNKGFECLKLMSSVQLTLLTNKIGESCEVVEEVLAFWNFYSSRSKTSFLAYWSKSI